MNKRGLLGVAIRVLGVWVLLRLAFGVLASVCVFARATTWESSYELPALVVGVLAMGAAGVFPLLKADWLSARLVRGEDVDAGDRPERLHRRLFAVAVRLLGLVYVLRLLPNVFQMLPPSRTNFVFGGPEYYWPALVTGLIAIAVASYLLLGGRLPERLAFRRRMTEGSHETQ